MKIVFGTDDGKIKDGLVENLGISPRAVTMTSRPEIAFDFESTPSTDDRARLVTHMSDRGYKWLRDE